MKTKTSKTGKVGKMSLMRFLAFICFIFLPLSFWFSSVFTEIALQCVPLPNNLLGNLNGTPVLLDRDGKMIAQIATDEARVHIPIPMEKMGRHLPKITVALEDHRFMKHDGVDLYAVIAAAYRSATHANHLSGASTISQQTVKLADKRKGRTLKSKVREALLALKLERLWSKDTILEAYINRLDYGNRRLGPEAAAWAYFGKPATELTLSETIFIAGLPHSPTRYNPWLRPNNAKAKYERSVNRLKKLGILTQSQSNRIAENPPLVRRELPPSAAPAFIDAAFKSNAPVSKSKPTLTTLDLLLQRQAEDILTQQLISMNRHAIRNAGMVIIENSTGAVRALASVASNEGSAEGAYNAALVWRHSGSTLKPFVYLLAIDEKKITAATLLPDTPNSVPLRFPGYEPENYNRKFHGPVLVRSALGNSLNVPAVVTLHIAGARNSFEIITRWGLKTNESLEELGAGFILGNRKIRLIDLAAAYSNLARSGLVITPAFIPGVMAPPERLASEDAVKIITDILSDNDARSMSFGHHSPLHIEGHRTAAKTGTSSSHRDAWTVGFDRDYTVAVWFGNLNGQTMAGSLTIDSAAPAWRQMILHLANAKGSRPLIKTSLKRIPIDGLTGLLPCQKTRNYISEMFLPGTKPTQNSEAFYDSNGKIILPEEYATWCTSKFNHLTAKVRQSPKNGPRILQPTNGATFLIDPELPVDQQRISLLSDSKDALWQVNGNPLQEPYLFLSPGTYFIMATTERGSTTATVTVR